VTQRELHILFCWNAGTGLIGDLRTCNYVVGLKERGEGRGGIEIGHEEEREKGRRGK
jgi:hypothetical protein